MKSFTRPKSVPTFLSIVIILHSVVNGVQVIIIILYDLLVSMFKCSKRLSQFLIGERAKRARHSQVCTIENRRYNYGTCDFSL